MSSARNRSDCRIKSTDKVVFIINEEEVNYGKGFKEIT